MAEASLIAVAALWLLCSVLSYGYSLAYFQRRFNRFGLAREHRFIDTGLCLLASLFGPACLASVLINQMTCYGWTWRPIPESEVNDDY